MVWVLKDKRYVGTLMLAGSLFLLSGSTLAASAQFGEASKKVSTVLSVLQDRLSAYIDQSGQMPTSIKPFNNEFATVETQKEKWQQYALMQDNNMESNATSVQPLVTDQEASSDLGVVRQNDSNIPQQPSMFEQQAGPMPPILQDAVPAPTQTPPPMQTVPPAAPGHPEHPGHSSGPDAASSVPAPVQGTSPTNAGSSDFSPLGVPSIKPAPSGSGSSELHPLREEGTLITFEQENTLLDFAKLEEEFKNDLKEATHNPSVVEMMAIENEPMVGERYAENNIDFYGNAHTSDVAISSVNKEKQSRTKVTQQVIIVNIVFFLSVAFLGMMWQKRRAKKVTSLADELRS